MLSKLLRLLRFLRLLNHGDGDGGGGGLGVMWCLVVLTFNVVRKGVLVGWCNERKKRSKGRSSIYSFHHF